MNIGTGLGIIGVGIIGLGLAWILTRETKRNSNRCTICGNKKEDCVDWQEGDALRDKREKE